MSKDILHQHYQLVYGLISQGQTSDLDKMKKERKHLFLVLIYSWHNNPSRFLMTITERVAFAHHYILSLHGCYN